MCALNRGCHYSGIRPSAVILSAAKNLCGAGERFFAALRMTASTALSLKTSLRKGGVTLSKLVGPRATARVPTSSHAPRLTGNSLSMLVGPRATARVPTPHPLLSRPYNDDGSDSQSAFIVRTGVVEQKGGDPCGRPRTLFLWILAPLKFVRDSGGGPSS